MGKSRPDKHGRPTSLTGNFIYQELYEAKERGEPLDRVTFRRIAEKAMKIFHDDRAQFDTQSEAVGRVRREWVDWKERGYDRPIYDLDVRRRD